jgi:hypothetical protein
MEIHLMEMDVVPLVQLKQIGHALSVLRQLRAFVVKYAVMVLLFKLYQITATMEILQIMMDVVPHVRLKPIGHELLATQHHKVYEMTYVEMAKK